MKKHSIILICIFVAACNQPQKQTSDEDFEALIKEARRTELSCPDSSLMILRELLPQQQGEEKAANRGKVLNEIGSTYEIKGIYDSAAYYLYEASRLAEKINDDTLLMNVFNNLGILQFDLKNADEAVKYYQQALAIAEKLNDSLRIANQFNNIGNAYMTITNEYDKAIPYLEKCVEISEKIEYKLGALVSGTNLAQMYNELNEPDKALREINRLVEQHWDNIYTDFTLAEIYLKKGNNEKALHEFKELLKKPLNTREFELVILNNIASIYKITGNLDSTVVYLERLYDLRDTLHNQQSDQTTQNLKISYETEKKETQIEQQKQTIRNERIVAVAAFFVIMIILIMLWYMLRLRKKKNLILKEANDTKDRFFNIISHDLKNPAIMQQNALKMLLDNSNSFDENSLRKFYEELVKSADNQVELLYNLLNWAQISTGRMPFAPIDFNLAAKLNSDISLIKNMTERKGINFSVEMPEEATIFGDSNMICTVIRNLLTNSVKFTEKGGDVVFRIETLQATPHWRISISDTGTGMTAEQISGILNSDKKQSQQGTAGETGSGLGLIVCRELLEKHNSTLHIESEEGRGSRFWFEI